MASDGNWYPPEATPGAPFSAMQQYGAPQMTSPYGYSPYAPRQGTNGLAIASMVLGILWIYWVGSILAIIFGFVALSQMKERNQGGRGMAIAGLVLGFIGVGTILLVVLVVATGNNASIRFSSVSNSIN